MNLQRTRSKAWKKLVAAGLVGMGAVSTNAQNSGFWLTGIAPGANSTVVTGLSKDGSSAAGGTPSFVWTKSSGRNDFGVGAGLPKINYAMGMSDNAVVAGSMWVDELFDKSRAYRWVGSGALQDLGVLPGHTRSFADGISGDATIVVGHCESGANPYQFGEAFRWTAATGIKALGKLTPQSEISDARAISRDGSTIVGFNKNEVLWFQAFVWTETGGMKALPALTGVPSSEANGTVVAGSSKSQFGPTHAVRWVNGLPQDLASPSISFNSDAYSINDDGSVVGGSYSTGPLSFAFIWSEATGMLDAKDYLAPYGITVPTGYKLEYVYAISGDGRTFAGQARNLTNNKEEGFVATIPWKNCVADCDASGGLDIDDFICFQTRFAISDPYADCDASGELDIDDFICFQTSFAVGC